jgi:hypothetical protein
MNKLLSKSSWLFSKTAIQISSRSAFVATLAQQWLPAAPVSIAAGANG